MSDLPKTKRFTLRETDEFEYASELAVRHLQLMRHVSLDQIICDPDLALEFDEYAKRLAPGFTPLEYRWVALGLRKAGRLQNQKAAELGSPELRLVSSVPRLKVSSLHRTEGIYMFASGADPVFLGQTDNLRHRIERHMDVSNSCGLPDWLWNKGALDVALVETPGVTRAERQSAELLLVKRLHPVLNYQRVAA